MENVLDCGLQVGAGRIGVTYGLGFEPHEKHMHKESRSYAKANTAAAASFYTLSTPTSFCVYFNFYFFDFNISSENDTDLPLFTSMPSLTSTLSSPAHSHIWTQSPFLFLQYPLGAFSHSDYTY